LPFHFFTVCHDTLSAAAGACRFPAPDAPAFAMGYWNLYFAAKLLLAWAGILQPVWGLNLLLGVAVLVPLRSRRLGVPRQVLAMAAAAGLAYYEAGLSPPARVLDPSTALSAFSPSYLFELAGRLPLAIVILPGFLAVLIYVANKRLGQTATFILLAVAAVPVWHNSNRLTAQAAATASGRLAPPPADAPFAAPDDDYGTQLRAFHSAESGRRVSFGPMSTDAEAQFDIIVLHICSLSWDDMNATEARSHPLLSRFDYLFENFNSATSYSNPAAIRLLRASCGQQPHDGQVAGLRETPTPPIVHVPVGVKNSGLAAGASPPRFGGAFGSGRFGLANLAVNGEACA